MDSLRCHGIINGRRWAMNEPEQFVKPVLKWYNHVIIMIIVVLDKTFEKLLTVVPHGLSREKTRTYLNEYQFREISIEKGIITDFYFRPNAVPSQSMQVLFKNERPYYSLIALIYPTYVPQFIARIHRRQQFGRLRHILIKQFGRPIVYSELSHWTKDRITVTASMPDNGEEGKLSIDIKSYDTNVIPCKFYT